MNETPFRNPLRLALESALDYLENLDSTAVSATAPLELLRTRLGRPLPEAGTRAEEVVADLVCGAAGGLTGSAGGRFFAWVIGGSVPAALAADWLTSAWDQNAGIHLASPAAAVVEEVAGQWLKELLGIPASASFAFVTGCTMAHLTCLAAARHSLLAARGWDVEKDGLFGAPAVRIVTSCERHTSVERAAKLLGIGLNQIVNLATDAAGRLPVEHLREALRANGSNPAIVLLQAGDLNCGAFDDFRELIPVAKEHRAWVHIDGAFGLWAAASPRFRGALDGVELADSWATDGHKMLNVPYDCGYAFVADPGAHRSAISLGAPYLPQQADTRDQIDWNPEWSRRARGFATYAAIRELGRTGIADLVERCCDYAKQLVTRIGALDGAEVLWTPTFNQGLVRFDETDRVIARILQRGEAFFGATTWRGQRVMRVSVVNWQTSQSDIDRTVEAVAQALRDL